MVWKNNVATCFQTGHILGKIVVCDLPLKPSAAPKQLYGFEKYIPLRNLFNSSDTGNDYIHSWTLFCLTAEMSDRKQPNVNDTLPRSNPNSLSLFVLHTHTHTRTCWRAHTYTSISYLHQSHSETTLERKTNMYLNPPAEEKSIVFCSPTLKKIVSSLRVHNCIVAW